ncbi:MAG TPA: four-carbon acid sugar kinase family protein [Ramlibacter sp.]|nr:four-carbon acid sugar kinase family protein [Ramlibacter sp.]
MRLLIVADDLSGAADCAIAFVRAGQRTIVALRPSAPDTGAGSTTLSIDADTRRLDGVQAAQRTLAFYQAQRRPGQRLYKKIDSTLRGNWPAEVAALRPLAGMAIVAPAYPALGRTVSGGNVYVDGVALAETALWQLEHAHRPAGIAAQLQEAGLASETLAEDALADDAHALSAHIEACAARGLDAVIVDASSAQALRTLAFATAHSQAPFFWVGSGGLAREIAALQASHRAHAAPPLQRPPGPTLVLVGSLSAVSDRQCAVLRDRGAVREVVVPPSVLRQGPPHAPWQALHARIGELLAGGSDVLLRIGREPAVDASQGPVLAAALAALVGPHFAGIGALVATGGETARAMLVEAGIDSLELVAELQPGVAAGVPCLAGAHRPTIVTKAGGFGDEQALYDAWFRLQPPSPGHLA